MVMEENTWFLRWGSAPFLWRNVCSLAYAVLIYFLHDNVVSRLSMSHFGGLQSISSVLLGTVSGR